MREVYLISCCRTPIGTYGGSLKDIPAAELGAVAAREALKRGGVSPELIDETLFGCVLTSGLGQNVARQVAVKAGVPYEKTATTIGMVCGSGMKSVIEASRAIRCGDTDIMLVGGAESMSRAAYSMDSARFGARMGDAKLVDTMIRDGLTDAFYGYHMGITAENVAEQWGITREELDEFALNSQKKAINALQSGRFDDEIVPVEIKSKHGTSFFARDEYPRVTDIESLSKLKPAFKKDGGMVTAGNSSGLNDGAAALVLASGEAVEKYGLKPIARLVSCGHGGVDPSIMGVAPVRACRDALSRAGLEAKDIDLLESNEAFAAQSVAVVRELGIDIGKVNVNGGAIALGHPIGASGARIIVTLIHEMLRREDAKYGMATLCIGGGMATATVWEKL